MSSYKSLASLTIATMMLFCVSPTGYCQNSTDEANESTTAGHLVVRYGPELPYPTVLFIELSRVYSGGRAAQNVSLAQRLFDLTAEQADPFVNFAIDATQTVIVGENDFNADTCAREPEDYTRDEIVKRMMRYEELKSQLHKQIVDAMDDHLSEDTISKIEARVQAVRPSIRLTGMDWSSYLADPSVDANAFLSDLCAGI